MQMTSLQPCSTMSLFQADALFFSVVVTTSGRLVKRMVRLPRLALSLAVANLFKRFAGLPPAASLLLAVARLVKRMVRLPRLALSLALARLVKRFTGLPRVTSLLLAGATLVKRMAWLPHLALSLAVARLVDANNSAKSKIKMSPRLRGDDEGCGAAKGPNPQPFPGGKRKRIAAAPREMARQ